MGALDAFGLFVAGAFAGQILRVVGRKVVAVARDKLGALDDGE